MSSEINEIRDAIAVLNLQIQPLEAQRHELHERLAALLVIEADARLQQILADAEDPNFVPEVMLCGTTPSDVWYQEQKRQLQYNGFYDGGSYWSDTNQGALTIQLTKGDTAKTDRVCAAIEKLLPHVLVLNKGMKSIRLFEHTLSQYDSYSVDIYPDTVTVGGRWYPQSFATLREALAYAESEHWYDDPKRPYYNGEDED